MGQDSAIAGLHRISCHVMRNGWTVHFLDSDGRSRIGPWLLCDCHDEVLKIFAWGHISPGDLAEHHRDIARWGVGGGALHLSRRERHKLIARGHRWPWNGYELRKMKEARRYPPQRLTMAQESAYCQNKGAVVARF